MGAWTAVVVTAVAELAEPLESFLLDRGAPGLQREDIGAGVRITAHFVDAPPLAALDVFVDALGELFPGRPRPAVAVQSVADEPWAENWKMHFPALEIGARLFVHPPWVGGAPAGRIGIVLDPGMAFGTGHHASTRGCLVLLERALAAHPGARVLDLGTGSGILAIAAAGLGAGEIWAVDTDPEARAIAAQNARANQVAAAIATHLHPGGTVIGAGVLVEEASAVRRAWRAVGLADDGALADGEWVVLTARSAA